MQDITAAEPASAPPTPPSRSWERSFADLRAGLAARELWSHIAWQDIRQRYRRSLLGPFWLTITMAVTTVGLGVLFSLLLGARLGTFLPYVGTGLIVWAFISGCLLDGMQAFISSAELIRHLPAPLTTYVLRTIWRQVLIMAHNLIIYVVLLILFFPQLSQHDYTMGGQPCGPGVVCHPGLGWGALLAVPGFLLLVVNAGWLTLLVGVISARYRDIPNLVNSIVQMLFFLTPVSWPLDSLLTSRRPGVELVIQLNPLFHFVQIVRQPLIGQQLDWWSWVVVGGIALIGWVFALIVMRNYRARVPYWV